MRSRRGGWVALLAAAALGQGWAEAEAAGAAAPAAAREAAPMLTERHARARAARVGAVAYDLEFELDGEAAEYAGSVRIDFWLTGADEDLTLDFTGGTASSVTVNGHAVDAAHNGFFLTLPAARLTEGANAVEVRFSNRYSSDGSGLYRFRDPADGRDYLYTDFQPYDQNRLFPSFDQPDLKATFATRTTVPAAWQVISIVPEATVEASPPATSAAPLATSASPSAAYEGDRRLWTFPESPPVSTYIYALHAGDYRRWESAAGEIPLRLFARASVAERVRPDDWFLFTRQGFGFFEGYFDVPYPFGKYDQIIVPHFNAGAMENVAAVTFSERFLTRGAVTRGVRRSLASVILHELAHMWFGNLVTMDWWNGLWLNESFATYMAGKAMEEATEFTETPIRNYRRSVTAYRADERDTTHPIELPVPDTAAAFANFDAITYSKGGATLAQLERLVGAASFRRGVGDYLKANAWGTTTVDDFLGAIGAASDMDLDRWARDWLHEPGTNGVAVEYACEDAGGGRGETVAAMAVLQTAPAAWPTLRTHRTQLGLHRFPAGGGVATDTVPVTYAGERTEVPDAAGLACPDLVYANHGNWDYARVRLDRETFAAVDAHLEDFADPLMRSMLWHGVQDMMADARLSPVEMIGFALAHAEGEADDEVFRQAVGAAANALGYLVRLSPDGSAGEEGERVESWFWRAFEAAEPGSDRQTLLFDRYVGAVTSEAGIARLAGLFEAPALPEGFDFDQGSRWDVLGKLAGFGHPATGELLEAETARDPGDWGRLSALSVTAARPDRAAQRRLADSLLDPDSGLTVAEARAIGGGLFPAPQKAMRLEIAGDVLARLPEVSAGMDSAYFSAVTYGLLGAICDAGYLAMLDETIEGAEDLHPSLRKALLDQRFEVRRCLAIGAAMDGGST